MGSEDEIILKDGEGSIKVCKKDFLAFVHNEFNNLTGNETRFIWNIPKELLIQQIQICTKEKSC